MLSQIRLPLAAKLGNLGISNAPKLAAVLPSLRSSGIRHLSTFYAPVQTLPLAHNYQLKSRPLGLGTFSGVRFASHFTPSARIVDYEEVLKLSNSPPENLVIVDVREPSEYAQGHIPHAINVPYKSMPGALGLDSAEFQNALGFDKPATDKTLLFYCKGGVRSTHSEQLASTYGYTNRLNYKGSYDEWEEKQSK